MCADRRNRNQDETLTQNYRRLGLTSRLNAATGGIEKRASKNSTVSKLSINNAFPTALSTKEARVERDPETGKITRVIHQDEKFNPLNDALMTDSEDEDKEYEEFSGFEGEKQGKEIVALLEEQAARPAEKKPRSQSVREKEWCQRLVEKHGQDFRAMMRDRKLNPMQQTEADISRRVTKFLSSEA